MGELPTRPLRPDPDAALDPLFIQAGLIALPGQNGVLLRVEQTCGWLSSTLSPKTIRRHVDNLWLLGGEIIRDLDYDPSLRKPAGDRLLRGAVHEDGGPLVHNGSEEEQRSFDSTCRKFHRFLTQPQP